MKALYEFLEKLETEAEKELEYAIENNLKGHINYCDGKRIAYRTILRYLEVVHKEEL